MGLGEKKALVAKYVSQGLTTERALEITRVTRHQYYYKQRYTKRGRKPSDKTALVQGDNVTMVDNRIVIEKIKKLKSDPDLNGGYKSATKFLMSKGFIINKKKTRRLMKEELLLETKSKKQSKNYVKYRKVMPKGPLEVLEMDIKMVWIEREQKQAFVLNIIDTFTRKWLYRSEGFSITKHSVKKAWEHIIINHLQPNDCLRKDVYIEIRNDNDPRFTAKLVQDFFHDNHMNQVFTHPYTPQENGHVESFHAILNKRVKRQHYWTINELTDDLDVFMDKYNNVRQHTSIAYLSPNDFEQLWNMSLIELSVDKEKRKMTFKLKIPRHKINELTGNDEPEGSSLARFEPLDGAKNRKKEVLV